jgi:hypothetical protein
MRQMGYTSCKADPGLWYKAETRPDDNFGYYAFILCYNENILCVNHDPMNVINLINGYTPLKQFLIGDPDIYLGAKLKTTQLENGIWAWGLSPSKYVTQAVKNCAKHLTNKLNKCFCFPQRADNPSLSHYYPELDLSDSLDPECSSFYQHLIGVMRWMVELGRNDIANEVSLLSSHLAYPCKGHLKTALHMMSCLSHKHNT